MKIFKVGGAVRDQLLGNNPKDLDYVVIGSSAKELQSLGFHQVGLGFPVFIHPQTRDEYALPRGTSLEDDLYRRDLTINAMALDETGALIDPFGGLRDLKAKVLRHVSEAFAEDPFRVYRILRFRASYPDFTIAPETEAFMKKVTSSEEFKTINSERLMKELRIVFSLGKPSLFFAGLKEFGLLSFYFIELVEMTSQDWSRTLHLLDQTASTSKDLALRFSTLSYCLTPENVRNFCHRIQAPNDWTESAMVISRFHKEVEALDELESETMVRMFYEMDGFRKPYLVEQLAQVCESKLLRKYFDSVKSVSAKDVGPFLVGAKVGEAILVERVKTLVKIRGKS